MKFNPSAWIRLPVEYYPHRPCIKYMGRTFTYGQINQRANRLARTLINRGFTKGSRIATLQHNCHQSFELFIGLWKAGLVNIPLNTRDSVQQNIEILRDASAEALIFGHEFSHQIAPIQKALPHIRDFICHGEHDGRFLDYEKLLLDSDPQEFDLEADEDDLYKIHYTSGTTGRPRGVLMTYRNRMQQIYNVFMNADRLISKNDIFLHVAPLTHAAGYYATPYYLKGALHVILDKFDPEVVLQTLERQKVTVTLLVPTMIVMLLEHPDVAKYDYSHLARIFYGTAPMPEPKLRKAVSVFGQVLRQNYGLTEAVQPLASLTPLEHVVTGEEKLVSRLRSAGRRSLGVELRIVDENDRNLPQGQVGEILLRGFHISAGYLNRVQDTADTYRGGWLHTGDLGRRDEDGYLFIVDRKKDMIISGGFNIYSREVELHLEGHPAVLECAVVGHPDEKWGEICKACIVVKKDADPPAEQDLVDWCLQKGLSRYKLPKIFRFLDSLPKNENNKILKSALKGI